MWHISTNSFTRPEEGGKEGGEEGGSRTRRNVTTAGCFVNYFLRAVETRLSFSHGDEEGRGGGGDEREWVLKKKKAKIGVQTKSREEGW